MEDKREDFDYMTEKIKPHVKRKLKKLGEFVIFAVITGLVFGFVARLVFESSGGMIGGILGISSSQGQEYEDRHQVQRSEVSFRENTSKDSSVKAPGDQSTASEPSLSPTSQPQSENDRTADKGESSTADDAIISDSGEKQSDLQGQQESGLTGSSDDGQGTEAEDDGRTDRTEDDAEALTNPLAGYVAAMGAMRKIASRTSEALVTVRAITGGINWLDENIETSVELTGVLMGDNGVEILALTQCEKVAAADRIEVLFADGYCAPAQLYGKFADLDMAVVAIAKDSLPKETYDSFAYIGLGESGSVYEGEPIIALGRPNGIKGAVEYGFVSTVGGSTYITDGVIDLFTTDIGFQQGADGIIVDLNGEMIGLIANSRGSSGQGGVSTAIGIDSIRPILRMLVNGYRIPYFGIRAENIPDDVLAGMGIENGVYVNEVINYSTAQNAGLRKGDVILSFFGEPVTDMDQFMRKLMTIEPGEWVNIRIFRGSLEEEKEFIVTAKISYK